MFLCKSRTSSPSVSPVQPDAIAAWLHRPRASRRSRGVPVHAHARHSSAGSFFPSWPPWSTRGRRGLGLPSVHARTHRAPPEPGTKGHSPSPVSTTAVAGRREPGSRSSHVSELIKMTSSPRALSDVYTEANKSTSLVLSVDRNTHTHLRKTKAYKLITLFK